MNHGKNEQLGGSRWSLVSVLMNPILILSSPGVQMFRAQTLDNSKLGNFAYFGQKDVHIPFHLEKLETDHKKSTRIFSMTLR